ncbi:MAG: 4a-hydroxytetrahydrobiopterin dehydratase [Leadbetterella sp.]|nr:4a-hydroxytetrahydrobiopterin dehydratase [Leadbetterella sp.]
MEITIKQTSELIASNWKITEGKLHKLFNFKNYTEVVNFTKKVYEIVEKHNHHPEIIVNYSKVDVSVNNHEEKNISDKCYLLAKDIDFINNIPSI